jgi:hypothetical protein
MSSVRETILQAIATALTGATPAGAQVFRSRAEAMARDELPAIVVTPEEESDQLSGQALNESTLAVAVAIHTRGEVPDQLADPVAVSAHGVLMSSSAIAALAHRVRKSGSRWERDEADQTAGILTTIYTVRYLHPVGDITRNP